MQLTNTKYLLITLIKGNKFTYQYLTVACNCHCLHTNVIVMLLPCSPSFEGGQEGRDGQLVQDATVDVLNSQNSLSNLSGRARQEVPNASLLFRVKWTVNNFEVKGVDWLYRLYGG